MPKWKFKLAQEPERHQSTNKSDHYVAKLFKNCLEKSPEKQRI